MDNSILKQKNKKRMLIGIALILLLAGGFLLFAFMGAPDEPSQPNLLVSNDNLEVGTPNTEEIPDDKLDVKNEYDTQTDANNKNNSRQENVFKEFSDLDDGISNNDIDNGANEFEDADTQKARAGYDRAQAQLAKIEERKRIAANKERERIRKEEAREEERRVDELRNYQKQSSDDFFSAVPISSDGTSNAVRSSNGNQRRGKSIMNNGPTDEMILATVKADQKVMQGERVTLVLEKDYVINGVVYPRNTKVYGIVSFGKNRVNLSIAKINHDVVDMYVEDAQDGLVGIYVRGADLIGEVAGEALDDSVDDINIGTIPVGSTIKSIFKKKRKEVKVQLLNDYHVLLKPNL